MNFDILRSENIMPDEAIEFLKLCSRAGLGVASVGYHGSRADEILKLLYYGSNFDLGTGQKVRYMDIDNQEDARSILECNDIVYASWASGNSRDAWYRLEGWINPERHRDLAFRIMAVFDIVLVCDRYVDDTFHVSSIESVTGNLWDGDAETLPIFEYMVQESSPMGVKGYFQQTNPLDVNLRDKLLRAGVSEEEMKPFVSPLKVLEGKTNLASQRSKEV